MAVIKGLYGRVYLASIGAGVTAFTDEAMTADVAEEVFTIDDATKRFWDPDTAMVIDYNGSPVTSYDSIQYPGGVVTWGTSPGSEAVTATGAYLAIAQVAEVKGFTLDTQWESVDVTVMGDTMRVSEPIFRGATISIDSFYVDDTYFTEMTTAARIRCGFDLFVHYDGATPANCIRYTGYGVISSETISTPVDGVIDGPINITVIDGPYYMSGLA